jgi:Cation transporting ATPase, C-terminus
LCTTRTCPCSWCLRRAHEGRSVGRGAEPPSPDLDPEESLIWGVAFELAFAAAVVYAPPLQTVFHTRGLGLPELLLLATFPVIVWGSDELRRAWLRRRVPAEAPESQPSAG